jgi:hypothetical protein
MVIVIQAVRVSSWLPGFARCQWDSCEGADTQAPSTVENKCLFEERYCYVALNCSLRNLKT